MNVRLQLFTVPGQVYYTATRKLVLTGADGVVFVADSQSARLDANQESLEDLAANLAEHGRKLSTMPHAFQWNKRDLPDIVPTEELDRRFNVFGAPALGTVATSGVGVYEGLERITRLVIEAYKADLPPGDKLAPLLDADDLGIAQAIRGLAEQCGESPVPRASSSRPNVTSGAPVVATAPHGHGPTAPSPPPPSVQPVSSQAPHSTGAISAAPVSQPLVPASGIPSSPSISAAPEDAFSLSPLWPDAEQAAVRRAEALLSTRDAHGAVLACDVIVTRVLASAAGFGGSIDAPRDPSLVALLLGLEGRRYLEFRGVVRAARAQREVDLRSAYECFLFALEAGRARDRLR